MNPVALVTGASSGIGAAAARRLVEAGFTVYGAARRTDRIPAPALPVPLDLTDEASIVEAVAHVLAAAGRIDVLVNNAGYGCYGAIEDVPIAEARRQFEVNLFGLARLVQLVLPGMRARGSGTIINVSSMGGRFATAFGGWYHATKFAVEGISDSLRQEVARFGVRVVVIEPGAIDTEWGGIAMRSGVAVSGAGPYGDRVRRMAGLLGDPRNVARASKPDVVGRAIARAARARRPRTRYAVGMGAKPMVAIRRLVPDRVLDAVLARVVG